MHERILSPDACRISRDMDAYISCSFDLKTLKSKLYNYPKQLKTLGDHLRAWRIDNDLKQSDVAKKLKVDVESIRGWEQNRHSISRIHYPFIEKLISYFPKKFVLTELSRPLLNYRKQNKISSKNLAKLITVDATTLEKAEKGQRKFQKSTLLKLSNFVKELG